MSKLVTLSSYLDWKKEQAKNLPTLEPRKIESTAPLDASGIKVLQPKQAEEKSKKKKTKKQATVKTSVTTNLWGLSDDKTEKPEETKDEAKQDLSHLKNSSIPHQVSVRESLLKPLLREVRAPLDEAIRTRNLNKVREIMQTSCLFRISKRRHPKTLAPLYDNDHPLAQEYMTAAVQNNETYMSDWWLPVALRQVMIEKAFTTKKYFFLRLLISERRHYYTIPRSVQFAKLAVEKDIELLRFLLSLIFPNNYANYRNPIIVNKLIYEDPNREEGWTYNAFHYAAKLGKTKEFLLLAENPVLKPWIKETLYRYDETKVTHSTCLHIAAQEGNTELVDFLLKLNVIDLLAPDFDGKTCAEVASTSFLKEKLGILIENIRKQYLRTNVYSGKVEKMEIRDKAIERLVSDLKQIMHEPLPLVQVFPLERNFFCWHVILSSPPKRTKHENDHNSLAGIKYHFLMNFPDDYPRNPPKIQTSSYLPHPFVYGSYLCLDMLSPPTHYHSIDENREVTRLRESWSGWSSSYTVQAILMQLQSFLFTENFIAKNTGLSLKRSYITEESRRIAFEDAYQYYCHECGYNIDFDAINWEEIKNTKLLTYFANKPTSLKERRKTLVKPEEVTVGNISKSKEITSLPKEKVNPFVERALTLYRQFQGRVAKMPVQPYGGQCFITLLPDDILAEICDYLVKMEDLISFLQTCIRIRKIEDRFSIWKRRELLCFYTKTPFFDDILGVGIYVERHRNTVKLKTLKSPLDLISRRAYLEDEIRDSAYLDPFQYWLPLPITDKHAKYALPLIKSMMVAIKENFDFMPKGRNSLEEKRWLNLVSLSEFEQKMSELRERFDPLIVLDILPKLMNHMVVSFMLQEESSQKLVPLHVSEKALLGYCSFHHILLYLAKEFPVIQQNVDFYLSEFKKHESRRVKMVIPDLGEMLVKLSFSSTYTWKELAEEFLSEFFDRCVLWIFDRTAGNHGELAFLEADSVSEYRLETSLQCMKTATRLLMFQVFFLQNVAKPSEGIDQILSEYNRSYGNPPRGTAERLQASCKKIKSVKTWSEFYERIGLPVPSDKDMTSLLRNSVRRSEKKGYHIVRVSQNELEKWRKTKEINIKDFNFPSFDPDFQEEKKQVETVSKEELAQVTPTRTNPTKIFVKNLSYRTTDDGLKRSFQQFGDILEAKIIKDEITQKSKGEGFVIFAQRENAQTATEYMHEAEVDGRTVYIKSPFSLKSTAKPVGKAVTTTTTTATTGKVNNSLKDSFKTVGNSKQKKTIPKEVYTFVGYEGKTHTFVFDKKNSFASLHDDCYN